MDEEGKDQGKLGQAVGTAKEAAQKVDEQAKKHQKRVKIIKFLASHPYLALAIRNINYYSHFYIFSNVLVCNR